MEQKHTTPSTAATQGVTAMSRGGRQGIPFASFLWLYEQAHTLYLFTASDFVAVLIPQTLFASLSVLSDQFTTGEATLYLIAPRLPHVVVWIWLQLLVLDLANQRLPGSVAEDVLNKPWRPIPAQRVTSEGARQLLILSIVSTLAASTYLDATSETLLLFVLNWVYNDLGLANGHWLLRNLMNALGITNIGAGAMVVACGGGLELDGAQARRWWLLCAGVLMSTIHAQDLYDQEGDAARGRSTAPLVLGDGVARWSIAVAVVIWSVAMPTCIGVRFPDDWIGYAGPLVLGALVAFRVLVFRNVPADRKTFKGWALWTICLYSLPLVKRKGLAFEVDRQLRPQGK